MIYNVFDLGDANAKDIMVPRVNITFADVNSTYEELMIFSAKTVLPVCLYTKTHRTISSESLI